MHFKVQSENYEKHCKTYRNKDSKNENHIYRLPNHFLLFLRQKMLFYLKILIEILFRSDSAVIFQIRLQLEVLSDVSPDQVYQQGQTVHRSKVIDKKGNSKTGKHYRIQQKLSILEEKKEEQT